MAIDAAAIAAVAYEAYRGYAFARGESVPLYSAVPDEVKTEYEGIVTSVLADNDITAADAHQTLVEARTADDWVYGLSYDLDAKTDPLLVDFDALTETNRALFIILVAVAVAMTDYEGYDAPI